MQKPPIKVGIYRAYEIWEYQINSTSWLSKSYFYKIKLVTGSIVHAKELPSIRGAQYYINQIYNMKRLLDT